jgi:L-arabinose isomerase
MEDYTYHLVPGEEKILGAHMLEVCPTLTSRQPSLEIHPLGIGGREDPVRLRFTPNPVPASSPACPTSETGSGSPSTRSTVVEPDEELPRLPVACAVWEPRPSLSTSAEAWLMAGAPAPHRALDAVDAEVLDDFAEMTRTELVVIDDDSTHAVGPARAALERRLPPARPGAAGRIGHGATHTLAAPVVTSRSSGSAPGSSAPTGER